LSKKKLKLEDFPEVEEGEEKPQDQTLAEGITLEDYPLGDEDNQQQELLAEKERQLAEEKDRYLRLFADFDNFKKRISKEKSDIYEYGHEALLKELLPIMDNFERALESARKQREEGGGDFSGIVDGLELILNQWVSFLGRFGVKPIAAMGKPFDPNLHEAIGQVEAEEESLGKVVSEAEKGYLLKNRLLRPARVVVGKLAEVKKEADSPKEIEIEVGEENPEGDDSHGD
jgi:molecular chaperone GrpE